MTDENTTPNNENDQEELNINIGKIVETPQQFVTALNNLKNSYEAFSFIFTDEASDALQGFEKLIKEAAQEVETLDKLIDAEKFKAWKIKTISNLFSLRQALPSIQNLVILMDLGLEYGMIKLQEVTGLTAEEIDERSSDGNNGILEGSLLDLVEDFSKSFTIKAQKEIRENPKYQNISISSLYNKYAVKVDGYHLVIEENSPLQEFLNDIDKRFEYYFDKDALKRALLIDVERVKHYPIKTLKTPVDLTTKTFFGINPPMPKKNGNGQWEFIPLKIGSEKKPVNLFYTYNVNLELLQQLGISNKFTSKDLIICSIIEGFRESGNKYITLTQLHKALGNTSSPNSNQLKELEERLTKLLSTTLNMDTREIAEAYNLENYDEYIGSLLPITLVKQKKIINGQLVEGFIEIQGAAPLIALAKNINQVTAVNPKLLQVKITHNEMFYAIFNYLLTEIAHIKNPNYSRVNKIVYKTLFKEAEITKRQEPRALTIMTAILDHFIDLNFITGWKEETKNGEPGVKFTWNNTEEIEDKANKK